MFPKTSIVPLFFHIFSGYDWYLILEQLLTKSFELGLVIQILPKSMENYVSVLIGCLRFVDSFRFLSSNLEKLVKILI